MPTDGTWVDMLKHKLTRKFLLYVFFAGFAALVNFASRFLYEALPGVSFEGAVALAYISGMAVNFAFSKWITFQAAESGRLRREAIKFLVVASVGLLTTLTVAAAALRAFLWAAPGFEDRVGLSFDRQTLAALAHLAGMAAGLVANFLGHELISFRRTGIAERISALWSREKKL